MRILISPRKAARWLSIGVACLIGAHLGVLGMKLLGHERLFGLCPMFDLGGEQNAPTLYSTSLLLLNGLLFVAVWKVRGSRVWLILAAIFGYLSLDEFCEFHEQLSKPIQDALHTSGIFYYAWVLPYGLAVLALAFFVLPAIGRLPRRTRNGFLLSAAMYLSGAVGMELVESWYFDRFGVRDFLYGILVTFEEGLEMAGLVLLTYTLLRLVQEKGDFEVVVSSR